MVTTVHARNEIPGEYKWNLEAVYAEDTLWENDLAAIGPMLEKTVAFKGRLGESAGVLLDALHSRDQLFETMERIFAYARMRRDEDTTNSHYQALEDRAHSQWTRVSEALSFFSPELLEMGEEKILGFINDHEPLHVYRHQFDELFREKEHLLSAAEEALLAGAGEIAAGPGQIFEMMTNADMKYGTIKDEEGVEVELTQGNYIRYIRSKDRNVRKDAFLTFHKAYA